MRVYIEVGKMAGFCWKDLGEEEVDFLRTLAADLPIYVRREGEVGYVQEPAPYRAPSLFGE